MANSFAWYICPYDVLRLGRTGVIARRCAMCRYIPNVPNINAADWDEAQILGNYAVVKVYAPSTIHTQLQADVDFLLMPHTGIIAAGQQPLVQTTLTTLGYSISDILATGFDAAAVLSLLTTAIAIIQPNLAGDGIVIQTGRASPAKTVDDINARLAS